jgi:IS5 family transposase
LLDVADALLELQQQLDRGRLRFRDAVFQLGPLLALLDEPLVQDLGDILAEGLGEGLELPVDDAPDPLFLGLPVARRSPWDAGNQGRLLRRPLAFLALALAPGSAPRPRFRPPRAGVGAGEPPQRLVGARNGIVQSLVMGCALLFAAPSSTKNAAKARDPEMHQTKKGNQWYFGMMAHLGVDSRSKRICNSRDLV